MQCLAAGTKGLPSGLWCDYHHGPGAIDASGCCVRLLCIVLTGFNPAHDCLPVFVAIARLQGSVYNAALIETLELPEPL